MNETFNLSHEEIALRVGKSRAAVTNTIRLLRLSAPVKNALAQGTISEGHGRAMLALPEAGQDIILETILKKNLSVRQTEELVHQLMEQKPPRKTKKEPSGDILAIEERLRNRLGTKVQLNHGKKGGSIVIYYYSSEELDSILSSIDKE